MKAGLIVGHNSKLKGAYNHTFDMSEYDICNDIVKNVHHQLEKYTDIESVIIYRTMPYRLLPAHVNSQDVDIAVSFHLNAFNKKAKGYEVLYCDGSTKGKIVADAIHSSFDAHLGELSVPRGIKPIKKGQRGYPILKYTSMPCVLTEGFFMDNDEELYKCYIDEEGNKALISAYTNGILQAVRSLK